jgi:biopolymer transport protein TolR
MCARRKAPAAKPEINVTPLVDVVLVLLIIFMVIAPALEHGERVDLPTVANADAAEKNKMDPITVTIGQTGNLFFEKEVVSQASLIEKMRTVHAAEPTRRVVLKGDALVPYERVREVFASIQDQGVTQMSLVVSKKKTAAD